MSEQPDHEQTAQSHDELSELSEEGRSRIRQEQAEARARRRPGRTGLIIVNTGNGKGKTTAALGVLMRAWGQDLRVVMLQFLKAQTGKWGEIRAAQRMGVEIIPLGDGFTWTSDDLAHDQALAQRCWQLCRERIEGNQYDIVIMDEITYALAGYRGGAHNATRTRSTHARDPDGTRRTHCPDRGRRPGDRDERDQASI